MALKDLIKATKADRYTADGRDQLNEALKADVEDRTYKTGEISEKTGLQKQPDGSWAPPKKGGLGSGTGKKETENKPAENKEQEINSRYEMEKAAKSITPEKADAFYKNYGLDKTGEHKDRKGWLIKEYKNSKGDIYRAKFDQQNRPVGTEFLPKGSAENPGEESKPAESKSAKASWKDASVDLKNQAGVGFFLNTVAFEMTPAWAKKHGYSPEDVNGSAAQNKLAKQIITSQDWNNPEEAVKKINNLDFGYNNWKVTEKQADKVKIATRDRMGNLREITIKRPHSASDAAPRLTGDTRLRLSQVTDKVYQIGEISQKTGLQKTANGWRPVKKGAGAKAAGSTENKAGSINRTPERIAKETAIMEALNLSTGEDNNLHKMSDETIERLYAKTQEKPAAGKTTIRQGPNTKTLNETPAEHIQKNLDAYKGNQPGDMEGLVLGPSGYKRQTSARIPSGGQSITYTKEGEEDITLFFDKDGELENADVSAATKPDTEKQVSVLMEKYKDLPGAQKKDALYAATFEGSPIGMTQTSMERQGWDLVQADDDVNVYGKPDGSKITMKHDGNKITSTEYEAPGSADSAPRELTGDCKIRVRR